MNELTLAIKQNPGTIEMNFDALEEQLDKKLDEYRGAVFTEDTKTIAKAEIASLRRSSWTMMSWISTCRGTRYSIIHSCQQSLWNSSAKSMKVQFTMIV